jgi:hypothetical protein
MFTMSAQLILWKIKKEVLFSWFRGMPYTGSRKKSYNASSASTTEFIQMLLACSSRLAPATYGCRQNCKKQDILKA